MKHQWEFIRLSLSFEIEYFRGYLRGYMSVLFHKSYIFIFISLFFYSPFPLFFLFFPLLFSFFFFFPFLWSFAPLLPARQHASCARAALAMLVHKIGLCRHLTPLIWKNISIPFQRLYSDCDVEIIQKHFTVNFFFATVMP